MRGPTYPRPHFCFPYLPINFLDFRSGSPPFGGGECTSSLSHPIPFFVPFSQITMIILSAGASCGLAIIAGIGATLTYAHRQYSDVLAKWEKTNLKIDAYVSAKPKK